MKIPYHGLLVCGDVLLATRGCNLHTFSIKDGSHLYTWTIPSLKKEELSEATPGPENGSSDPTLAPCEEEVPAAEDGDSGPPSKRRKVERGEAVEQDEPDQEVGPEGGENVTVKTKKRGRKKKKLHPLPFVPKPTEQPMVQCLTATGDGKYIVAVTGLDKTIWVFEHDGTRNLKQLSRRPMPKRPSSITLTLDNKTILSADKFGDVISLPLISEDAPSNESPQSLPSTPATPSTPQPFKPQANPLTVHTQRNLRALANQARLKDKPQPAGGAERRPATDFEHTLLLGHVSMLTAIATTTRAGRPYIVTADRDEHIRVSRGAPQQAHVVETFCLGHGDFVSRLCVPPGRPELLVSGGGDDALFVWDWFAGELLSKAYLLSLVQAVLPGRTQLAVSMLRAFRYADPKDGESETTWVFAGCEAVPALFLFRLEGNNLLHLQTVRFEGNLLDAVVFQTEAGPRLLAALDGLKGPGNEGEDEAVTGEPSLVAHSWDAESGWQPSPFSVGDGALDDGEADITRAELRKSLYTIEPLRKMEHEEDMSMA